MKDAVLLVPGMMCDARVFGPQIEDLSRDFAVHIASITDGDTIREMAANVIHQAPPKFALAGQDMGGIVALEILRRVPDRITRLTLMATTPLPETPEQAAWREPQIIKAQTGKFDDALHTAMHPDNLAPGPRRTGVIETLSAMAHDIGPHAFIRQSRAMQRRPDAQKVLGTTRVPTMVLCGEHDLLTPVKRHAFMAELLPYAELVVLDDAGHVPTLETPEKVNLALRAWLDLPVSTR